MSKAKHNGRGKLKGSADARRDSTPRKGGYKSLDRDDEHTLSRMLEDWRTKEKESAQGATIDSVIDGLIRRGLVAPTADSRRGSRPRDDSDVDPTDDDDHW